MCSSIHKCSISSHATFIDYELALTESSHHGFLSKESMQIHRSFWPITIQPMDQLK